MRPVEPFLMVLAAAALVFFANARNAIATRSSDGVGTAIVAGFVIVLIALFIAHQVRAQRQWNRRYRELFRRVYGREP